MKPERENDLVDLLDRLLNKGLVLNADLIISVAGVPLIGISLKAALASIETMLEYGMMEAWDKSTREWYADHYMKNEIQFTQDETIIYRTFGSIWHSQGIIHTWRPGFWYLTNKRLLLWRKEPAEMLFEVPLEKIEGLVISREVHFKKEREEIYLQFDGKGARIHVSNTREFKEAVEKAAARNLEKEITGDAVSLLSEGIVLETNMWYLFPAMGILGETWKPGRLCLTRRELYWVYSMDEHRMFEVPLDMITSVEIDTTSEKTGSNRRENILTITYNGRAVSFSGEEQKLHRIKAEIEGMTASLKERKYALIAA